MHNQELCCRTPWGAIEALRYGCDLLRLARCSPRIPAEMMLLAQAHTAFQHVHKSYEHTQWLDSMGAGWEPR